MNEADIIYERIRFQSYNELINLLYGCFPFPIVTHPLNEVGKEAAESLQRLLFQRILDTVEDQFVSHIMDAFAERCIEREDEVGER